MSKKTKSGKKGFWERAKESAAQQQAKEMRKKSAAKKKAPVDQESKTAPPVEKTPEEKKKIYIDGIKKRLVPSLIATFAGVLRLNLGYGKGLPWLSIMLFVIIFSYYAQRLVYPLIGVDVKEFGIKDWFYVEFITIDLWLVVWTLLINPAN